MNLSKALFIPMGRDSLALDVLEPIRPQVEEWLLNWIEGEPLRRSDFPKLWSGHLESNYRKRTIYVADAGNE